MRRHNTENEQLLYSFLEKHYCGNPAFLKIAGDNDLFIKYTQYGSITININGEQKTGLELALSPDIAKDIINAYLYPAEKGSILGERVADIATIPFETGVFFSDSIIEVHGSDNLYSYYEYSEQFENTQNLITHIKNEIILDNQLKTDLSTSIPDTTLNFESGANIYIYKKSDGKFDDTVGVSYPGYSNGRLAYRISDTLLNEIENALTKKSNTDQVNLHQIITDFANELNFEHLPNFNFGETPNYDNICFYSYCALDSYPIKGSEFNDFTKRYFDIKYDVDKDYNIPVEIDSYYDYYLIPDNTAIVHYDGLESGSYYECTFKAYDFFYNETNKAKFNNFIGNTQPENEQAYEKALKNFIKVNGTDGLEAQADFELTVDFTLNDNELNKILSVSGGREQFYKDDHNTYRRIIEKYLEDLKQYKTIHSHKLSIGEADENGLYKCFMHFTGDNDYIYETFLIKDGICLGNELDFAQKVSDAFYNELLSKFTLKDAEIIDCDIKDYKIIDGYYQAYIKYAVKPRTLFYDEWVAGNGKEDPDHPGWLIDKTAFVYFSIDDGKININSYGTGP